MPYPISTNNMPTEKLSILGKITFILLGAFTTASILAIFTKEFDVVGLYLSAIILVILVFAGFYYIEKGKKLRFVTWGILGTVILIGGLYSAALIYIKDLSF